MEILFPGRTGAELLYGPLLDREEIGPDALPPDGEDVGRDVGVLGRTAAAARRGHLPAMDIEEAIVAQVKEVATRGEVRQKILDRFFSDTGALTAAEATGAQLLARIEERNAESKRLLAAFSDADVGGAKTLAKRLGEIETDVDHLRIQLGEVDDRLRALTGAQRPGRTRRAPPRRLRHDVERARAAGAARAPAPS